MLGKLIKHEFTATGRIISILLAVLIIISPITALYLKFRTSSLLPDNNVFLDLMEVLCIAVYVIAMIAAGITTVIVLLNRFYQSMITRESYLTHTLPVTTHQLIISKLLVAAIWQIICMFAMLISFMIFIGILGGWSGFVSGFHEFIDLMLSNGFNAGSLLLLLISMLVSLFVTYLKCYAAFATGHLFNGHPFLGFIVSYIAISTITQIVSSIALFIFNITAESFMNRIGAFSEIFDVAMIMGILCNIVFGVIFYIVATLIFNKKLNI